MTEKKIHDIRETIGSASEGTVDLGIQGKRSFDAQVLRTHKVPYRRSSEGTTVYGEHDRSCGKGVYSFKDEEFLIVEEYAPQSGFRKPAA